MHQQITVATLDEFNKVFASSQLKFHATWRKSLCCLNPLRLVAHHNKLIFSTLKCHDFFAVGVGVTCAHVNMMFVMLL
jgi:hypothetical protein